MPPRGLCGAAGCDKRAEVSRTLLLPCVACTSILAACAADAVRPALPGSGDPAATVSFRFEYAERPTSQVSERVFYDGDATAVAERRYVPGPTTVRLEAAFWHEEASVRRGPVAKVVYKETLDEVVVPCATRDDAGFCVDQTRQAIVVKPVVERTVQDVVEMIRVVDAACVELGTYEFRAHGRYVVTYSFLGGGRCSLRCVDAAGHPCRDLNTRGAPSR